MVNQLSNELPFGWAKAVFQDIVDSFKRGPFGSAIKKEFFVPDGFKVYEQKNAIYDDPFRGEYYIDKVKYDELAAFKIKPRDFIVSCSGTIGRILMLPDNPKAGIINQALLRIRIDERLILHIFFLYLFRSEMFQKLILVETRGSAMKNITGVKDLKLISITIPPLPEQHRIVAKIEELFSELDNGIENLKKAREQLKTYRQAVLKYAFEGKLTKGSVKAKNVKIKDLFTLIDGDRGRNYPKKDDYLQKGFCLFLSTKNVRFGKFEFYETVFISEIKHNELRSGTLKRGDIVITTRGTIGNVAFYDERIPYDVVRINSGMLILRAKSDKVYEKYFLHYVGSPKFWNQIQKKRSGTAQPQLPAGVLKEFDIPLFAKGIQRNIVQEIESRLSVCDKIEQTIEDSLKKAEALRQSILKKAFAGELTRDWREKHPELITGENSAEKLLEKIKAEKAIAASRKKPRSKKTKKK